MGAGHKTPVTIIKNIGIVQGKNAWWSFNVKWLDIANLPYKMEGKVFWRTIERIKDPTLLDLIKKLAERDISHSRLPTADTPEFPLNQILHGLPGTGKTYNTVTK